MIKNCTNSMIKIKGKTFVSVHSFLCFCFFLSHDFKCTAFKLEWRVRCQQIFSSETIYFIFILSCRLLRSPLTFGTNYQKYCIGRIATM